MFLFQKAEAQFSNVFLGLIQYNVGAKNYKSQKLSYQMKYLIDSRIQCLFDTSRTLSGCNFEFNFNGCLEAFPISLFSIFNLYPSDFQDILL